MQNIKRHLISASITFIATFAFFFFGLLSQDTFEMSRTAIMSALAGASIAGIRASAKILFEFSKDVLSSKK